jgi:hypothetical protein
MTPREDTSLRIVGVHGVGHYDGYRTADVVCAAYSADWARHLAAGLAVAANRLDVSVAYYAPELHPGPVAHGGDLHELQDLLAKELMAEWLETLGAPASVSQGALTLPLRYAASWVADKFSLNGRLTNLFIQVFFTEAAAYLRGGDNPARLAAREQVADRIAQHRPRIVIAHSLGTVVTYEALHAHPELTVDLLLTLGSPLALPGAIFDRLIPHPANGPTGRLGARPEGVKRWVNIADPGDPVAIPPRLARAFQGIALDLTDTIHVGFGFHHARNYLSCAATAASLGPFVGR